jgi:hypothetical protein
MAYLLRHFFDTRDINAKAFGLASWPPGVTDENEKVRQL